MPTEKENALGTRIVREINKKSFVSFKIKLAQSKKTAILSPMNKQQLQATYLATRVKIFAEYPPSLPLVVPLEHRGAVQKWLCDNLAEFEREAETFAEKFCQKNAE